MKKFFLKNIIPAAALLLACATAVNAQQPSPTPAKKSEFAVFASLGFSGFGLRRSAIDFMDEQGFDHSQAAIFWGSGTTYPRSRSWPSYALGAEGRFNKRFGWGIMLGEVNSGSTTGFNPNLEPYKFEIEYRTLFFAPYASLSSPQRELELRLGPLAAWHRMDAGNFEPKNKSFVSEATTRFQPGATAGGFLKFVNRELIFFRFGVTYSYAGKVRFDGIRADEPSGVELVKGQDMKASCFNFSLEMGFKI